MIQVIKGNVQLTINEDKLDEFLKLGYSQIDEKGEIVKAGQATTLKEIKEENMTLKAELAKYQAINLEEIEAIKAENETLKAELEAANKKSK